MSIEGFRPVEKVGGFFDLNFIKIIVYLFGRYLRRIGWAMGQMAI
jgi:hypothetical protein